ncbi:MAG: CPBP family intramembrane glutamic endopeptidase [Burkholderiaceae bacterium]
MFRGLVRSALRFTTSPVWTRIKRIALFFAGAAILGIAWQLTVAGLLGKLFPGEGSAAISKLNTVILSRDWRALIDIVVVGPVIEEFIFRYALFKVLNFPRLGVWPTIVLSALPFGLVHLHIGPLTATFATLTGLIHGYVYATTKDIWCAVGTHSGINVAALGITAFTLAHSA